MRSPLADRWLRRLLGVPGRLLDLLGAPARGASGPRSLELDQVHARVRVHARHPEAHLALEAGLSYHLHQDLLLAYDQRGGTAFAVGGLNAPVGQREGLLRSFRAETARRGVRRQLVFPLREDDLDEAERAGFHAIQVGVEAWLDLPELRFRGRAFETVRHLRRVAARRGVQVEEIGAEDCPSELQDVHAAWLQSKRPRWRMRLLVGSPGLDRPYDRRYLVARTPRRVEGFVTLVPGQAGEWGIDVMCRRPDATKGTMEALICEAVDRLRDQDARTLSLGPCPMAEIEPAGEHPLLRRTFRLLYGSRMGNRVFGFRNLHRFKQKFRPRWEPVYFGAAPDVGVLALYQGCRMWGLYES